jgi:hypothetical protein
MNTTTMRDRLRSRRSIAVGVVVALVLAADVAVILAASSEDGVEDGGVAASESPPAAVSTTAELPTTTEVPTPSSSAVLTTTTTAPPTTVRPTTTTTDAPPTPAPPPPAPPPPVRQPLDLGSARLYRVRDLIEDKATGEEWGLRADECLLMDASTLTDIGSLDVEAPFYDPGTWTVARKGLMAAAVNCTIGDLDITIDGIRESVRFEAVSGSVQVRKLPIGEIRIAPCVDVRCETYWWTEFGLRLRVAKLGAVDTWVSPDDFETLLELALESIDSGTLDALG